MPHRYGNLGAYSNHRSGIALAVHRVLKWFIYLRDQSRSLVSCGDNDETLCICVLSQLLSVLENSLSKLARYDQSSLFSSILSLTVSVC